MLLLLSPAQRAMLRTAAEIAVGVAFMHSLDVVHGGALAGHPRPPPPSSASATVTALPPALVGLWISAQYDLTCAALVWRAFFGHPAASQWLPVVRWVSVQIIERSRGSC